MTDDPVLTPHMELWQLKRGRDLRLAIIEAVAEAPTVDAAARKLGISYHTLRLWMRTLDIRSERTFWIGDQPIRRVTATDDPNETPLAAAG